MAALTPTVTNTEYAGEKQTLVIDVTPSSASDTVDLSSYCSSIDGIVGQINAGLDAAFTYIQVSFSGTTVTIASFEQDGTAATDWTSVGVTLIAEVNL